MKLNILLRTVNQIGQYESVVQHMAQESYPGETVEQLAERLLIAKSLEFVLEADTRAAAGLTGYDVPVENPRSGDVIEIRVVDDGFKSSDKRRDAVLAKLIAARKATEAA